jgi:hypothetical protein
MQHFTIKLQEGVVATSYKSGDKFFIDPMKLLPMERFLNADKKPAGGGTFFRPLVLQPLRRSIRQWYSLRQ